ncbi:Calcineurin-like phosphoesterase superfamily domain protein [Pseudobythopirellula maris]|uniref:Calcineurin-like phosphoesterase superfamily domain protein n=1 Tax=Pseudobythopirellula maris TaxID=2527991 RepID=A0A5C5ZHK3_9BACT|nr:metallophosphoesterase [Pseudobythopirellula maris]TWT86600.1 Calcineurin-like phosphoesterase superfamily domain protein [Pseudobythopirellula maris]
MNSSLRCFALLLLAVTPAWGHENHADESHDHAGPDTEAREIGAREIGSALALPTFDGPKPWSDKPVLSDEGRFQIAIMTDRTGGHRPGVWMQAVRKLNMLRPEFVVSVGDLIEGYTDDRDRALAEWREFLGFIDRLEMKFFFVAGNHDVTNPMLHKLWRERFGKEWYSFDYRGVHFLCLSSEDPTPQHLSDEQVAFVRSDLDQHADASHTLVFLHKPLWTYAERDLAGGGPDRTNWKKVEALLAGRPHTVFSGHVHHYVQYERNGGSNYYSLATTGGGSQLRGDDYGEFDHVTWLTMQGGRPHVVNLRLEGILPHDVVTEESANTFRGFLADTAVEVAPILLTSEEQFTEGDLHLRLVNDFGETVELEGEFDGLPLKGLTVDPQKIRMSVGPTGVAEKSVRLRFEEPMDLDRLSMVTFVAKTKTLSDNPLRAERLVPVLIDRKHTAWALTETPKIDGELGDWRPLTGGKALPFRSRDNALVLDAPEHWQGPTDGSFAFAAAHDEKRLYFAGEVTDERLTEGDRLEFIVDGRPLARRLESHWLYKEVRLSVAPVGDGERVEASARRGDKKPIEGVEGAGHKTEQGYAFEASLPIEVLSERSGDDAWRGFQLAVVLHDVDDRGEVASRVLWRGSPSVDSTNTGYGQFLLD